MKNPGLLMTRLNPEVSVLMTAYNRELFIADAIESVLASTYTNFELIIVDDCSTDNTLAIANHYSEKDCRIKVYRNEVNIGQFPNRNKAATYAKGKYLKYLDSDDMLLDFGLAYCVQQMEKFPEAFLGLYCGSELKSGGAECWASDEIIHEHFFGVPRLFTGPTGTIINREKFIELGGFDCRFGVPSDMYFNIRFASQYPVVLLPELFVFYRRHEGQELNNRLDYLKYGYLYLKEILEKVPLPLDKTEVRFLYRKMKKRHSVNLIRFLLNSKDARTTARLLKATNFRIHDCIFSLFY